MPDYGIGAAIAAIASLATLIITKAWKTSKEKVDEQHYQDKKEARKFVEEAQKKLRTYEEFNTKMKLLHTKKGKEDARERKSPTKESKKG